MGIGKVIPPREKITTDPEILWRVLQALCYEVNRELVIDVNCPLISLTGGTTPTPTTYGGGAIRYPGFIHTSDRDVDDAIEFPHGMRLVQSIKPHVHWVPTTTGTGNVKWAMTYTMTAIGDIEPAETTISITDTADGTAGENKRADFPVIDVSLAGPNTQFSFNLKRDTAVASNYGATVLAKTVGFHITVAAFGSRDDSTL
jgi:hypothetical protein